MLARALSHLMMVDAKTAKLLGDGLIFKVAISQSGSESINQLFRLDVH